MKIIDLAFGVALTLFSMVALAQRSSSPLPAPSFPTVPVTIGGYNLPFQPIGASDLIHLTVYDSPELTQTFRVDKQGQLNLPLLHHPVAAAGLMPDVLRDQIAAALKSQHLLVNPIVDLSVVEYRSRDIIVAGAVKTPVILQDLGNVRVLDALAQAGGLSPEAGPEIIVELPDGTSRRLSVRELYDGDHPRLNISLQGGAQVRVPECQQVFVVGDVKRPGAFPFRDVNDTTVLQLLALSGGLDSFSRHTAYIYRAQPGSAQKKEIEVPLRRILDRKANDVQLAANDILYIPTNGKLKASASVLNHVTGMGTAAVSAAIWSSR